MCHKGDTQGFTKAGTQNTVTPKESCAWRWAMGKGGRREIGTLLNDGLGIIIHQIRHDHL